MITRTYKFFNQRFKGKGLRKFPFIRIPVEWVEHFIGRRPRPTSVQFDGHTIFLDPNDNQGLALWTDRELSVAERGVMNRFIERKTVAVDVGANIGFFTLLLARGVGPEGTVYAFEPDRINREILEKNIAANKYENVIVQGKAVAEKSGAVKLFLSDYNVGDHRIYDPALKSKGLPEGQIYDKLAAWERRPSVDVEVVTLDEMLANETRPVSLVKIDVQGAEGGVLKGMQNLMRRNPDMAIVMEFWPSGLAMYGIGAAECLRILEDSGFSLYEVDDRAGLSDHAVSPEYLLRTYSVENNKTGYLVAKRRRV